jgi:hypothetical protein
MSDIEIPAQDTNRLSGDQQADDHIERARSLDAN